MTIGDDKVVLWQVCVGDPHRTLRGLVTQDAYAELAAELAEVRSERDAFAKYNDLLTHKVITCGVAAHHPDPNLSKTGAYAAKWDSPQAQDVRALRDRCDAAESQLAELRATLQGIADANYCEWDDGLNTPFAFVTWAKSRAAHAISKLAAADGG